MPLKSNRALWSAVTCHRFRQATCRRVTERRVRLFHGPLDAALPARQVGQAIKAVTSHRTPNRCRICVHPRLKIRNSSAEAQKMNGDRRILSHGFTALCVLASNRSEKFNRRWTRMNADGEIPITSPPRAQGARAGPFCAARREWCCQELNRPQGDVRVRPWQ